MDISSLNSLAPLANIDEIFLLIVRIIFGITFIYYNRFKIRDLRSNAEDF